MRIMQFFCIKIYIHFPIFINFSTDTGQYEIVRPGYVSPERPVPEHIKKPEYYHMADEPDMYKSPKPEIKMGNSILAMRKSCRLAANILEKCSTLLKV